MNNELKNFFIKPTPIEGILTTTIALLIAFAFVLGREFSLGRGIDISLFDCFKFIVFFFAAWLLLFVLWRALDELQKRRSKASIKWSVHNKNKASVISGLIILVFWIPILLAGFPGFFTYDAGRDWLMQWGQIESGQYNAHHSIVHTFFLEVTIKLGIFLFGSFNGGVALSVVVQAIIIAAIFSLVVRYLLGLGMGRIGLILTTAYLAVDPIIGMFAFTTTKDSLFAALVMLYCVSIAMLVGYKRMQQEKPWRFFLFVGFLAFLIAILRTNALVGLLLIIPLVMISIDRINRKKFLVASLFSFVLALAWLGPVSSLMNVQSSPIGKWNSLCVFEQQIARCSVDDSVMQEDKELIYEKLPLLSYQDNLSDIARGAFMDPTSCSGKEKIELYMYLGMKYPLVYFEAFLAQTEDAWSPYSVIDCYSSGSSSSVFSMSQHEPSERDSKFPALLDILTYIASDRDFAQIPIVSLITSIPFYLLVLILCLARVILTKNRLGLCFLLPLAILALTNLFGPCMLIRYYLYLFFALPAMVYVSFFISASAAECRPTDQ